MFLLDIRGKWVKRFLVGQCAYSSTYLLKPKGPEKVGGSGVILSSWAMPWRSAADPNGLLGGRGWGCWHISLKTFQDCCSFPVMCFETLQEAGRSLGRSRPTLKAVVSMKDSKHIYIYLYSGDPCKIHILIHVLLTLAVTSQRKLTTS